MKKYKHLFFDLDRTIWDFEKASKEIIKDLFKKYELEKKCNVNFNKFFSIYTNINNSLWGLYRKEEISKEVLSVKRFFLTFENFGVINGELASKFSEEYIRESASKIVLFPNVMEVLYKLSFYYQMHIITNGFAEVQIKKLKIAGLINYFKTVTTAEHAGFKKPDKRIFEFALQKANANAAESLMIGDDFNVDVLGAKAANIDQIYCNFKNQATCCKSSTYAVCAFKEIEGVLC